MCSRDQMQTRYENYFECLLCLLLF
jgi:hypothetical protein